MIVDGLAIPQYDAAPLRDSFPPYGHQVMSRSVITEKQEFFLFITAPTGAGKTESWVVPALMDPQAHVTFALYPTNALAFDQFQSIMPLRDRINPKKEIVFVNAEALDRLRDEFPTRVSKGEILTGVLARMVRSHGGIVVTNPDIFILALKNVFVHPYVESSVRSLVSMVVFDEFHLYNLKQTDFLLYLFDDLISSDLCSIRKFVFLSATPSQRMIDKIQTLTGKEVIIAREFCGEREAGRRLILPCVDLSFIPSRKFGSGELFISRFDEFGPMLAGVRTAIIFDSAIEVAVVSDFLRRNTSYRVCEQSGFRKDPMDEPFDVLVGNKAVEVGIDFKGDYAIQQLFFSAFSVSEFLQRFGRLRNPVPDVVYRAVGFAPQQVCSFFASCDQGSREALKAGLDQTMQDSRVYQSFRWRWGFLEAWEYACHRAFGYSAQEVLESREQKQFLSDTGGMPQDKREWYLVNAANRLFAHYFSDVSFDPADILPFLVPLTQAPRSLLEVMKELSRFRGGGFSVVFFYQPTQAIKSYDLFFLLRWTRIAFYRRDEFIQMIPEDLRDKVKDVEYDAVGYACVTGFLQKPRSVRLEGPFLRQMSEPERQRVPRREFMLRPVLKGEEEDCIPGLSLIDKELMKRGFFCRYLDFSAYQAKRFYELGDYAALMPYKEGCLALGYDAFVADCAVAESLSFEYTLPNIA